MGLRGAAKHLQPAKEDHFPICYNKKSRLHNRIIQFIECLPLTPKEKVKLLPWQREFIRKTYAPQVKRSILSCGRKCGKSSLLCYMILSHLLTDAPCSEYDGELLVVSLDQPCARIFYEKIETMLLLMPNQFADLNIQRHKQIIENLKTRTNFSVEAHSLNILGKNPTLICVDEAGAWSEGTRGQRGAPIFRAIVTGAVRGRVLVTGTQNESDTHFFSEAIDAIRKKETKQDVGMFFGASPSDDISLESTWRKANPSLGTKILPLSFIRGQYQQTQTTPSQLNSFKLYHLNMRVSARQGEEEDLFPRERWLACRQEYENSDLHGESIIIGLDLAKVSDVSAIACLVVGQESTHRGKTMVYPYITNKEAIGAYRDTYSAWRDLGYVDVFDSDATDFFVLAEKLNELCLNYNVLQIAYDPYSWHNLAAIVGRMGYDLAPCTAIRQTWEGLSPAILDLRNRVTSTTPRLAWNSPVLTSHVYNARLLHSKVATTRGQVNITKGKRREDKIDCLSALLNALAYNLINPASSNSPFFGVV